MYRVIIIDDEAVVREGLKHTINWSEHGFELSGDYVNGREAWDAIQQNKPDLIISDISMPFMDGLELAGMVTTHFPYIKMIILTGFDEFEYAQQAIRLKVSDFILKPITAQEIRSLLGKVKAEMDEEAQRREDLSKLHSQLNQSLPLLKERFLERLVVSGLQQAEIEERFIFFGLPPISPLYLTMVIDIDDFGEWTTHSSNQDEELLRLAAYNIIEEIAQRENALIFRTREERMVVIVSGQKEERTLYELVFRIAEEMRHQTEKFLKFTITIGVGHICDCAQQLPLTYKSACSALEYRFLLGKNQVLSILDMEGKPATASPSLLPLYSDFDRKLVSAVKTGTAADVHLLIEQLVLELKASMVPIEACFLQIQKVVLSLLNTVQELGAQDQSNLIDRQLMDVYRFKTLHEIEIWLGQVVRSVMAAISDNRSHFTHSQMLQATDYIETNYANEKMSLQDLCRHVLMSTSYFSLVFKQHTGETFIEYLTRVRIEKAKELLVNTSLKFYEIAEKVGYGDPNYFSILFKKHAGQTPREFRERQLKGTRP
jgi:two-component system response regulator YesN